MWARWTLLLLVGAALVGGEVSLLSEDDSCDVCVIVTRAILKSFSKHSSSGNIETGFYLDPHGNLAKKKSVKYNKSETRFIEVMESVCKQMDEYRTNYWDPLLPKFVRRDKDVVSEDGETRTEFLETKEMHGDSAAELMLAFKRQIMQQFGSQVDDTLELKVACDHLLEDFEPELEEWYYHGQDDGEELDFFLCIRQFKSRLNYSCCIEEYGTEEACEARAHRLNELRAKLETKPEPVRVEDAALPPGQFRDEHGVIWQAGPEEKNPFADWTAPALGPDQIMDEQGVIWQVDPDGDAMRKYKTRIARERNEMARKAREWEEARQRKIQEEANPTGNSTGNATAEPEPAPDASPAVPSPAAPTASPAPAQAAEKAEATEKKSRPPVQAVVVETRANPAVTDWLSSIGMEAYAEAFASNGYDDLDVLSALTNEDLVEIGIALPGHRKKILVAAAKLARA